MGEPSVACDPPLLQCPDRDISFEAQVTVRDKKLLVQSVVLPHIRYCTTVWDGCSATQKHRIQKAINFGVRIVTGLARRDHVSPALEALGWERFEAF